MKTGIITCVLTALALSAGITLHAQTVSDKKDEEGVKVRVWLNKGEDRVIDAYLRSALVNRPDNIEISLTADGKRMRYVNEDVDSLLLDGSDKYVKRLVKMYGALGGPAKVEWVREEYRGKGIDLYSLFTVEAERTGRNITVVSPVRSWYLSIAGDMAIMVGSDTRNSIFDKAEPPMSGSMLNMYFGKIYDYPEFAARIREGEFSAFMDVIHAWEASYGGTALRVDGKLKDGQVGIQGGIASSDAKKNVDWKRTKSEIVFPKYTRTIQVGVSPVIAEWTKVMKHATDGSKSSFKMVVPPIMIYSDICFLDFGRFGSLGWSIGGEYSRYSYNWMLDNGYGDKQQDTFCNRVDIAAGLSYHITLCDRLELYARAMIDAGLIGEHTTDHESGEKASSTFNKMDTKMGVLATAGLRWYFCNKAGLCVGAIERRHISSEQTVVQTPASAPMVMRPPTSSVSARLADISMLLLYFGVFFLAAGIISGSFWANVSWGCYWNWDPKETWALITLLIYAVAVHRSDISFLRKPVIFHIFLLLAFVSVLFTYFGVNFLLGGMHSYAG